MKIQKTDFSYLDNYYNFKNCLERAEKELTDSIKYVPMSGEVMVKMQKIKELIEEIEI